MQDRARNAAERQITRHDALVTFTREAGEVINPFDPPPTPQSWDVMFLETGLDLELVDGSALQRGGVMGVRYAAGGRST